MKFSGLQFEFGKIKIFVNSIDTEKTSVNLSIQIPIGEKNELWLRVSRGSGWREETKTSVEAELVDSSKVKERESEDAEIDESMFEGEDGDGS